MSGLVEILPLLAASLTGATAAFTDARSGRIPNMVTVGSLLLALLWFSLDGLGVLVGGDVRGNEGLASSLLGMAAGGLGPLALFVLSKGESLGGGDVKLLAALGAWLGPSLVLLSILSGCLILLIYLLPRKGQRSVRMGPGLCAGTWLVCGAHLLGMVS